MESAADRLESAAVPYHRFRPGYASRAVIGTLRPTERRRATPTKWVGRVSSLELYVLPRETGNQSSVGATGISGCMPEWS